MDFEEDGGLDDMDEVQARFGQDSFEILQDADGLLGDSAGDELAGHGIECDLAGGKYCVSNADSL